MTGLLVVLHAAVAFLVCMSIYDGVIDDWDWSSEFSPRAAVSAVVAIGLMWPLFALALLIYVAVQLVAGWCELARRAAGEVRERTAPEETPDDADALIAEHDPELAFDLGLLEREEIVG